MLVPVLSLRLPREISDVYSCAPLLPQPPPHDLSMGGCVLGEHPKPPILNSDVPVPTPLLRRTDSVGEGSHQIRFLHSFLFAFQWQSALLSSLVCICDELECLGSLFLPSSLGS